MDDVRCTQMLDRFLTFYDQAYHEPPHKRHELWMEYYDFPHTPPGYQQGQLAKEMVEYAWTKYHHVYDKIQYFDISPLELNEYVDHIKQILHSTTYVDVNVLFFVGTFETDPFVIQEKHQYILCFPVELPGGQTPFDPGTCKSRSLPPVRTRPQPYPYTWTADLPGGACHSHHAGSTRRKRNA